MMSQLRSVLDFFMSCTNPQLQMPQDLYPLLYTTLLWGLVHQLAKPLFFVPLSKLCVSKVPEKAKESSKELSAKGKADSGVDMRKSSSLTKNSNPKQLLKEQQEQKKLEDKKLEQERIKFQVAGWKFLNFSTTTVIGLTLLANESWMSQPSQYYIDMANQPLTPLIKLFYQFGFGSYAYATLSVFIEPRQKDFVMMVAHHLVTLFLISTSYFHGFFRVGAPILLLHDMSDPFMELAKMFLYSGMNKVADVLFATFALVFIVTRNILFPGFVISSIPMYAVNLPSAQAPLVWPAFTALCILELMHIYWAYLIIQMIIIALKSDGVQDDIRNEKKED